MSVESCDSELLESAYANVGLHADPVWLLKEPDVYQRANQVLWVCYNRLWHHTRSFRVNNVLPQNRIQTRSVRDTIPFSRLARYGNYRYDEERESHYMCDDESGDARYEPIVCPEENPEPWMLPEVEQEFKRLTKEELPGEYTLWPWTSQPSHLRHGSDEDETHLGLFDWTSSLLGRHENIAKHMCSNERAFFFSNLNRDSESEDLCIYPVPRYSVTSLEEVQLEARMLSCHVKDIWDPRRRYRPCLNAEVPEFHPGSFPHFPSSRGLSHRAGLFPYIRDDDRGRRKTPSPHSDSALPKFPSTREHSCIDPVQYLPPISSSSIPVYSSTSTTVNRPQQGLKQRRTYENLILLTNSTPHLVEQCPSTDVSVLPRQIPVYQRPPEFYQDPTAPSDARRRQGVDYSNLIFLTKGQRIQGRVQNNAPHPSSQNEEHHSNQFGQSVEGTSNSLSMVYYDFKQDYRKCLPPITLTEEIYQECQNPTGSSSTTDAGVPLELLNIQDPVASTLIARWLSEVYQDRAVEFREVNLLSQECVRLESQLCCTTSSEIENSDTNFPPMKTSTPLKDVPPTAIEDIDISRISTTAPPSSIGTNSLVSSECKQQRRLYRDVVAAKCNSTHTQHQASEVIPADNSFDDLERQALEQYRNSEESLFKRLQQPNPSEDSISKRYQELERQAVEQYDESSSDDTETTNMTGEGGCRNGCPTACRNTLKSSKSTYGGFAAVNKGRLVVSETKSLSAICRDNKSERSCGDEGTGFSSRRRRVTLMCKKTPPVQDQSASEYPNDGGPQILTATGSAVRGLVASVGPSMGSGGGGDHTVQANPNEQRTQVSETVLPQSVAKESDPSVRSSRESAGEVPETWVHHDAAVPPDESINVPEVAFYRIRTRRRGFRAGNTKKRRGKRRQPKTAGHVSEDESVDDISEVMSNHAEINTRGKTIPTEEADDRGRNTVNIKPIIHKERIIETRQTINKEKELEESKSNNDNINLAKGGNQAKISDNTVQMHCKTQENKQMINFNEKNAEMIVNDRLLKDLTLGELFPDISDHSRGRAKRGGSIITQNNTMPQDISTTLQDFDTALKGNAGKTTTVPIYRFKGRRRKCCGSNNNNRRGKRHSLIGALLESGNKTVSDTDEVISNHKPIACKGDKHDSPTLKEEIKREDNKTYQEGISKENVPESEKFCEERIETNSSYITANCMSEERQQNNFLRENEMKAVACMAQQNKILLGSPRQGVVQIAQSAILTKQLLFGSKSNSISSFKVTNIKKVKETTPRKTKQCGESIRDVNSCTSNFVELECEYRRTSLSKRMSFLTLEFTTPWYFSERSKKYAKGYNPFSEAMLICRGRAKFPRVSFGMDLIAEEVCWWVMKDRDLSYIYHTYPIMLDRRVCAEIQQVMKLEEWGKGLWGDVVNKLLNKTLGMYKYQELKPLINNPDKVGNLVNTSQTVEFKTEKTFLQNKLEWFASNKHRFPQKYKTIFTKVASYPSSDIEKGQNVPLECIKKQQSTKYEMEKRATRMPTPLGSEDKNYLKTGNVLSETLFETGTEAKCLSKINIEEIITPNVAETPAIDHVYAINSKCSFERCSYDSPSRIKKMKLRTNESKNPGPYAIEDSITTGFQCNHMFTEHCNIKNTRKLSDHINLHPINRDKQELLTSKVKYVSNKKGFARFSFKQQTQDKHLDAPYFKRHLGEFEDSSTKHSVAPNVPGIFSSINILSSEKTVAHTSSGDGRKLKTHSLELSGRKDHVDSPGHASSCSVT